MRFSPIAPAAAATLLLLTGGVLAAPSQARQAPPVAATPPVTASPAPGKVAVHATWDSNFVYLAFQVDDTNVSGTNTRPLSHPEQDDSVGVYFQTGEERPGAPNANTHALLVSAAQGFTLLDGDRTSGALAVPAKPNFSIKYGVTVQGTLNRSDDRDRGYTVTVAIPFSLLGIDPATVKAGTTLGFNAVVRSRSAGTLTSLAPGVTAEADVANPSKWTRLTLLAPDGAGGANADGVNASEVAPTARPPLIDGTYRTLDWPRGSETGFTSPDRPTAVPVVAPPVIVGPKTDFALLDTKAPLLDLSQPVAGMQHLLMARYVPTYQADRRKAGETTYGVFAPDGTVLLADQPATGVGPWFSSERVSYHRTEMAEMRRAGIDVAVVTVSSIPGTVSSDDEEKALLALVSALRELAVAKTPAPQLVLCVDMAALKTGDTRLDLAAPTGRDAVYAAIRRWTRLIPPEFRARVLVPGSANSNAIVAAYPVVLTRGESVDGIADPDWTDTLRARFAEDFGGATAGTTLLFAGVGSAWSAAGAKLAAVLPETNGAGTGAVSSFVVQPGSASVATGAGSTVVSRRAGATYHDAWEAAITASSAWTLIDSWNDFANGTEVAASRQYGAQYVDATRLGAIQLSGLKPNDVRWLGEDAPRRMAPGQLVSTTVTLQNVGMSALRGEEGIRLIYRWRQNGVVIAEGPLKIPLPSALLPTRTISVPIGLAAGQFDTEGHFSPLLPGDYVAEVDLAQVAADGKASPFGDNGGSPPLRIPITVSADLPDSVQFSQTTTPALLRAGDDVPTTLRLRWLGGAPLAPADASLVTQILSADGKNVLTTATTPLPAPLSPGQWATIPLTLHFSDAGAPLPAANPDLRRAAGASAETVAGGYRIRYLLTRANSVEAIAGIYEEDVAVYAPDDLAEILVPSAPTTVYNPNARVSLPIRVVNRGKTRWGKSAYAVGYHWYDADGLETAWKPAYLSSIAGEVQPGATVNATADIRTPDHEGDYVLAIDVQRVADGAFLSTLPGSRPGSVGLLPVRVRSGSRLTFVDLAKQFTLDAVASDAHPADGDLDGAGHTFPAESFPPDRFGIVGLLSPEPAPSAKGKQVPARSAYPSGYYVAAQVNQRQIAFRYGPGTDGAKNALACAGQTIPVPHGRFVALHIVATATGGTTTPVPLPLTLHYHNGSAQTLTENVADWNVAAPARAGLVALSTHLKRGPDGDSVGPCTLYHALFALDVTRDIESITLGNDPRIKVFAVTLER